MTGQGASRQVSMAVSAPACRQIPRTWSANSHWDSTSPPDRVTPPSGPKNTWSRSNISAASWAVTTLPVRSMAAAGQASTQLPQQVQASRLTCIRFVKDSASQGQTAAQLPQCRQVFGLCHRAGFGERPSGFWHQGQRSGQPLRNRVLRSPAPSCTANRFKSKITPLFIRLRR